MGWWEKEKCPKCDGAMDMYYQLWCPRCDKPEVITIQQLNFVQCLDHLEAIGYIGIKERMWEKCFDDLHNDASFNLFFPVDEERKEYDRQHLADLDLIRETWLLGETIQMWVSW